MKTLGDSPNDGGDINDLISMRNKVCYVPSIVIKSLPEMLKSKEKRKIRRHLDESIPTSRGMDINPFYAKTRRQDLLWDTIDKNIVTIAIGSSGTGKTLVSLWYGLHHLSLGHFETIYYVRSDVGVEHQRGRGALPGSMDEKMAPLVAPVYDNLAVIMRTRSAADYLISKKLIQPILLEDIRGRSLNNAYIIFDEAQNSSIKQTKTVLTRVGDESRIVVTGDTSQTDLDVFNRESGLLDAYHRLGGINGIGTVQFFKEDVVRNGIIAEILEAYES